MTEPKSERRTQKRLSLALPVTIKSEQGTIEASGCTRDLSSSGIFLYSDAHFSEGSALEMVLILPKEMTGGEKRWVCCRASVVRGEASGEQRGGEAARMLSMEVLPDTSGEMEDLAGLSQIDWRRRGASAGHQSLPKT